MVLAQCWKQVSGMECAQLIVDTKINEKDIKIRPLEPRLILVSNSFHQNRLEVSINPQNIIK